MCIPIICILYRTVTNSKCVCVQHLIEMVWAVAHWVLFHCFTGFPYYMDSKMRFHSSSILSWKSWFQLKNSDFWIFYEILKILMIFHRYSTHNILKRLELLFDVIQLFILHGDTVPAEFENVSITNDSDNLIVIKCCMFGLRCPVAEFFLSVCVEPTAG